MKVAVLAVLIVVALSGYRGCVRGPAVYWQDLEGRSASEVLQLLGEPAYWTFVDANGARVCDEKRSIRNVVDSEAEVFMSWAFGLGNRMQVDFVDGVAVTVHRWSK